MVTFLSHESTESFPEAERLHPSIAKEDKIMKPTNPKMAIFCLMKLSFFKVKKINPFSPVPNGPLGGVPSGSGWL
jgi:hypothetical protein